MYDQVWEGTLFLMFYASVAMLALIACCYLLFRRGNAIAPEVTPPVRLRRWTAGHRDKNCFKIIRDSDIFRIFAAKLFVKANRAYDSFQTKGTEHMGKKYPHQRDGHHHIHFADVRNISTG